VKRAVQICALVAVCSVMSRAATYYVDPAGSNGNEGLFGSRSGADKKDAALSFVSAALSLTDAVTNRQVVDEGKFKEGLGKIIDGTVQCLNASTWAKAQ
jgi:hypothetical protein